MTNELAFRKSSYSGQDVNCVEVAHFPATFRTSSHSGAGQDCVEVARIPADFRKSSHSSQGVNCVEVAEFPCGAAVRDSKRPEAGHLAFPSAEWRAFITSAAADEL